MKRTKVKVKEYVMFSFTFNCCIHCYPQQKWYATTMDDESVLVQRGNVEMIIGEEDFEKYFKVV